MRWVSLASSLSRLLALEQELAAVVLAAVAAAFVGIASMAPWWAKSSVENDEEFGSGLRMPFAGVTFEDSDATGR